MAKVKFVSILAIIAAVSTAVAQALGALGYVNNPDA